MENVKSITITVAYADNQQCFYQTLHVSPPITLAQAIAQSGVTRVCPWIDLTAHSVGVFGQICDLHSQLKDGDRVEIYRSLQSSPNQARQARVSGRVDNSAVLGVER